jgi:competence protein ComEC
LRSAWFSDKDGAYPRLWNESFRRRASLHLLVVSGFNLAIVAAAALWLGRRLPFGRHQRTSERLFAIAVILSYAFLMEGQTPVLRATLMAVMFIVATLLDRGYAIGNSLCAAGIAVLFLDPIALEDSGFQLTFAAVLAILLLAVPLIRWGPGTRLAVMRHLDNPTLDVRYPVKLTDWRVCQRLRTEMTGRPLWMVTLPGMMALLLVETAIVTLSVQFALLPWSIESYHRLSPVALPLNILGAAVATIVTPLGLVLILVLSFIALPIGTIVEGSLAVFVAAVDWSRQFPGASFRVPSPPIALWFGFGVLLAAMAWVARKRCRGGLIAGTACRVGFLVIIAVGNFEPRPPEYPTLTFLDVGQGDALLVELANG